MISFSELASSGSDPAVPFLELRSVHKRFAGVHALRGVSLAIETGKIYHLMGENGCGKSTLIKIIAGAQPPDEGNMVSRGQAHPALPPSEPLAAGIETVYQDFCIIPNLNVAKNIGKNKQITARAPV